MDYRGVAFPSVVAVASVVGLWFHFAQAKKGTATLRDRAMGGLWAAMLVVAGARVLWIVSHPAEPGPGTSPRAGTK